MIFNAVIVMVTEWVAEACSPCHNVLPFAGRSWPLHIFWYLWKRVFNSQFSICFKYVPGWRGQQGSSCESPGGGRACQHQRDSPERLQTGGNLPGERLPQDPQSGGEKVSNQSPVPSPCPLLLHLPLSQVHHPLSITGHLGNMFNKPESRRQRIFSLCSYCLCSLSVN